MSAKCSRSIALLEAMRGEKLDGFVAASKPKGMNADLIARLDEAAYALLELQAERDALAARLKEADEQLSRVLHELAGSASLCWEPRPTGVFNSEQAIEFVAAAIKELRDILRHGQRIAAALAADAKPGDKHG